MAQKSKLVGIPTSKKTLTEINSRLENAKVIEMTFAFYGSMEDRVLHAEMVLQGMEYSPVIVDTPLKGGVQKCNKALLNLEHTLQNQIREYFADLIKK